ncbi:hypothetical protein M6B38_281070 [Iris pallida]|uniref:Uncharacterized protein n=1 Tax=Iris pallida TaxID=29817 RepID=A0AAX6I0G2_IRIPA|nr:hypothetical protein M6B38_281070 [Iris pallida]
MSDTATSSVRSCVDCRSGESIRIGCFESVRSSSPTIELDSIYVVPTFKSSRFRLGFLILVLFRY